MKNKKARSMMGILSVVILLSSILIGSLISQNSITANVVFNEPDFRIKEVSNLEDLSSLNEGWYLIKQGHVFYLEHFNDEVYIFVKVKNLEQQNGLLVVEQDGTMSFDSSWKGVQ